MFYCAQGTEAAGRELTIKAKKITQYPVIHTNYIVYPKAPLYNIIIIVYTVLRQKRNIKHEKQ